MAKGAYVGVENFVRRNLPSGYTQVAYIESDGNQAFDTGVIGSSNIGFEIEFETSTPVASSGDGTIFGCLNSVSARYEVTTWTNSSAKGLLCFGAQTYDAGITVNTTVALSLRNGVFTTPNGSVSISTTAFNSGEYIALFCRKRTGNGYDMFSKTKIPYGRFYDGNTLIRDYVPCVNSSGVAGLYDMVNGTFGGSATSTPFIAGPTHQGVARKIKKGYIGVGGVAHKIKKAYIGIGGVARPCWSGGELAYYGAITDLSVARQRLGAAAVSNTYALFAGGCDEYNAVTKVDVYNNSLTRSTAPDMISHYGNGTSGGSIGDYALFMSDGGVFGTLEAYDMSLTKKTLANPANRANSPSANIGNYVLFGGNGTRSGGVSAVVDAYDASLTKTVPEALHASKYGVAGESNGKYALYGGGTMNYNFNIVEAYDASLTKTTPTGLSVARQCAGATRIGDYVLFGGGNSGQPSAVVDVYDASLTRTIIESLRTARFCLVATTVGDYALFAGGELASGYSGVVDVYDASLTRTNGTGLSASRSSLAAVTLGDFALFAGGRNNYFKSNVDCYVVA